MGPLLFCSFSSFYPKAPPSNLAFEEKKKSWKKKKKKERKKERKTKKGVLCGTVVVGYRSRVVTAVAQVTAVVQVQLLAQELPCAMGTVSPQPPPKGERVSAWLPSNTLVMRLSQRNRCHDRHLCWQRKGAGNGWGWREKGTPGGRPANSLPADRKPPQHSASSPSTVSQSWEISWLEKGLTEGGKGIDFSPQPWTCTQTDYVILWRGRPPVFTLPGS